MLHNIKIEESIQMYIDGQCNEDERAEIALKISSIPVWRDTYASLREVHELLLNDFEPMEPSMRFTRNVMDDISGLTIARPARQFLNPWIFRIAGGILGTFLLGILVYTFSLADLSSGNSEPLFPIPSIQMPDVDWANYFNQGTTLLLFMVWTILGLYLTDKLRAKKSLKHL